MILLDTDVLIDLLRRYSPAVDWFGALSDDEEIMVPGYVVMELIQGCQSKLDLQRVQRVLASFGVVWPAPSDCDKALALFTTYHLSHSAGLLDALIGQTAVALNAPLHTFNQRHYSFMANFQTVQPYVKPSLM